MKIKTQTGAASPRLADGLSPLQKSGRGDAAGAFQQQLGSSARAFSAERMAALAQEIEKQSLVLSQRADIGEMERYRALIAELIAEVVANGYCTRRETNLDPRGRIKVCTTIEKINTALDALAGEILSQNKDTLAILSKIGDIQGLLVDMML